MYAGNSIRIEDAIIRYEGEAAPVTQRFLRLSAEERRNLLLDRCKSTPDGPTTVRQIGIPLGTSTAYPLTTRSDSQRLGSTRRA
jgi:hypothetical protein